MQIMSANSLRKVRSLGLIWVKVFSFFNTKSGMIVMFDRISPLNSSICSRISRFSTANMLLNNSFSALALSHGDTAFDPSSLSSISLNTWWHCFWPVKFVEHWNRYPCFLSGFAYFQNDFRFIFTLTAKFVLKLLLVILVVRGSLFLHLK